MPLRVLIVEDQQLVRVALAALLEPEGIEIAGEAADGIAGVAAARRTRPDLVLMDLSMPAMDGIEATRRIKRALPGVRVLILSGARSEHRVAEALAAGADGYALKWLDRDQLMAAIEAVGQGQTYIAPGLDGDLVREFQAASGGAGLTAREREVLGLIASGQRNQDIADRLSVAVKTVETHRAKIMAKLDLHNSAELATYAIRHGLIE